jgi:hypothetical protein
MLARSSDEGDHDQSDSGVHSILRSASNASATSCCARVRKAIGMQGVVLKRMVSASSTAPQEVPTMTLEKILSLAVLQNASHAAALLSWLPKIAHHDRSSSSDLMVCEMRVAGGST